MIQKENKQLKYLFTCFGYVFNSTDEKGKPLLLDAMQEKNGIPCIDPITGEKIIYNMRWREFAGNFLVAVVFEFKYNRNFLIKEAINDKSDGYLQDTKFINDFLINNFRQPTKQEIEEMSKEHLMSTEHVLLYDHNNPIKKTQDELNELFSKRIIEKLEKGRTYLDNKLFVVLDYSQISGEFDLSKCINQLRVDCQNKWIDYFPNSFVYINMSEQDVIKNTMSFNVTRWLQVKNIITFETYKVDLDLNNHTWKVSKGLIAEHK